MGQPSVTFRATHDALPWAVLHATQEDVERRPAPPVAIQEPAAGEATMPPSALVEHAPAHYQSGRLDWRALLAAVVFHVLGAVALLSLGVVKMPQDPPRRLTVFNVQPEAAPAPSPPPPQQAQSVVPKEQSPAPVTAPSPAIALRPSPAVAAPRPVELQLAAAEIAPEPAPAPPAKPAPITPPDFSAAQLDNPAPTYPYASRRNREEGVVLLRVLVSARGKAQEVQLQRTSGFERLDHAAIRTVRRWEFLPARQAGEPVAAWVIVPVGFALS